MFDSIFSYYIISFYRDDNIYKCLYLKSTIRDKQSKFGFSTVRFRLKRPITRENVEIQEGTPKYLYDMSTIRAETSEIPECHNMISALKFVNSPRPLSKSYGYMKTDLPSVF